MRRCVHHIPSRTAFGRTGRRRFRHDRLGEEVDRLPRFRHGGDAAGIDLVPPAPDGVARERQICRVHRDGERRSVDRSPDTHRRTGPPPRRRCTSPRRSGRRAAAAGRSSMRRSPRCTTTVVFPYSLISAPGGTPMTGSATAPVSSSAGKSTVTLCRRKPVRSVPLRGSSGRRRRPSAIGCLPP